MLPSNKLFNEKENQNEKENHKKENHKNYNTTNGIAKESFQYYQNDECTKKPSESIHFKNRRL